MNNKDEHQDLSKKFGSRHVQILLIFFAMAIAYSLRVSMSVAIVAMKNKHSPNPKFPAYDWDTRTSSYILSSFFWGYVITQVPSGHVASTRSAQKLLACGIFVCSILNILIPILASFGFVAVICCRVAMGLCQGCLLPCVQTLLSRWAPPMERARLGSFVMNGPQFGTVITMPISGVLAASSLGWPSTFYIFGIIGIGWSILFYFMGADYPCEHPTICPDETRYINDSLCNMNSSDTKPKIPWKSLLMSKPLWALLIVHSGQTWGFYTFLTEMPSYMKSVLNFDITQSGGISALPYLAMWLLGFPISYLSDFALKKGVPVVIVRKVSNSIGLWIPALAMLLLCLIKSTNSAVFVAILVVAIGFNCGTTCGFQINHIDLSPNFAGSMISVTNCFANTFGIVSPLICGIIVTEEHNVNQWNTIFYITAAMYFFSNLIFLIFGKANIQSWNDKEDVTPSNRRVSTISIGGEPTSLSIPNQITVEDSSNLS